MPEGDAGPSTPDKLASRGWRCREIVLSNIRRIGSWGGLLLGILAASHVGCRFAHGVAGRGGVIVALPADRLRGGLRRGLVVIPVARGRQGGGSVLLVKHVGHVRTIQPQVS